jgi:hypothetical protein
MKPLVEYDHCHPSMLVSATCRVLSTPDFLVKRENIKGGTASERRLNSSIRGLDPLEFHPVEVVKFNALAGTAAE